MKQKEHDVNFGFKEATLLPENVLTASANANIPTTESIVINGVQITKKKAPRKEVKMMEFGNSILSGVSLNEDVSMESAEFMVKEDYDSSFDTSIDTDISITSEDRALFDAKEAEKIATHQEQGESSNKPFSIEELRKEANKEAPVVSKVKENVDDILARYSHLDIKKSSTISPKESDLASSSLRTAVPVQKKNLVNEVNTSVGVVSVEKSKMPKKVKKEGLSKINESSESSSKKEEGHQCDICKKVISTKTNLKRHLLTHSKPKNC